MEGKFDSLLVQERVVGSQVMGRAEGNGLLGATLPQGVNDSSIPRIMDSFIVVAHLLFPVMSWSVFCCPGGPASVS